MIKCSTVKDVLKNIQSDMRVFVHGGAATPRALLHGLMDEADRLKNVELIHLHTECDPVYADPKYKESFSIANLFVGSNMRPYLDYDRIDYLPCFLSEIPQLFRSRKRPLDVALIHVSPPDHHGYCTLGVSVDVALAAVESAHLVLAQVNPQMPRVHGDGLLHVDKIHYAIEIDEPLPEHKPSKLSEDQIRIGQYIAGLVEDGSTIQTGIGAIPDAALAALKFHKHLGLHTEMWSDGALDLIEAGVIDNSYKKVHTGKCVSGFAMGSKRLYEYMHDNPYVIQLGIDYVNSPMVIMRNPQVVAINSAVQVDLTGQICADSVGHRIISGVGGQMDFMRGAALSEGGKPIIAITSRTKKGISRIVPTLDPGAGVVTTRSHVHYVVTEYGVADLYGKTLNERARSLIKIAHPDDQEKLERAWFETHRKPTTDF